MEWGENVGKSSRSGRITTTRHSCDGWCQSVFVCLCVKDLENIHCGVMDPGLWSGVKMSANHPDRDGSRRPVTVVMAGVNPCSFVCV